MQKSDTQGNKCAITALGSPPNWYSISIASARPSPVNSCIPGHTHVCAHTGSRKACPACLPGDVLRNRTQAGPLESQGTTTKAALRNRDVLGSNDQRQDAAKQHLSRTTLDAWELRHSNTVLPRLIHACVLHQGQQHYVVAHARRHLAHKHPSNDAQVSIMPPIASLRA